MSGPKAKYVPNAGDIVWLEFNPRSGHEQAGHRPALVLSPGAYNSRVDLMLCCPMTTQIKGYPFEVPVTGAKPGAVLSDRIKSVDWVARRAKYKGKVSPYVLAEVRAKAAALLGLP